MRDLPHLASLIFNRPLLVRSDIGRQIIDAIGPRILIGEAVSRHEITAEMERPSLEMRAPGARRLAGGAYMERDGVAVLPIVGSLVRRGTWLDAECGMMSYGLITNAVTEILMDASVRGLMLEMDSSGGEASGCFDCADFIRTASAASGKPVWAHANEVMCSAAYALGSSGSQVWAARTAEVGSIGVLGAHVDRSEADKMAGQKWTYVYSGEYKTDGNPHEPLTEGALGRMQADCDHLYDMFLELTSQNRGMTTQELRATNADIYRGSLAVDAGLVDEIGTLDEALEAFAEHIDETQTTGTTRLSASQMRIGLMTKKAGKTVVSADAGTEGNAEVVEAVVEGAEEVEGAEGGETDTGTEGAEEAAVTAAAAAASGFKPSAETERCSGLMALASQASRLGVDFDAAKAVKTGMSVDAARKKIMDAAATGDAPETSGIAKAKANTGDGGVKTMSADAKKSAWGKAIKRR